MRYETVALTTFNIRHADFKAGWGENKRGIKIVDILHSTKSDIICLQEAYNFQFEDIKNSLPDYISYGVGRNDGAEKGEFCPILFRKDRFALLDSGTFWFSTSPDTPGSKNWKAIVPRICSWVQLKDNFSDKTYYVYSLHITPIFKDLKEESISLLSQKIKEPCIIAGDFNMQFDNVSMSGLSHLNHAHTDSDQIDHVFCSKNMNIRNFFIEKKKNHPSDHPALTVYIDLY